MNAYRSTAGNGLANPESNGREILDASPDSSFGIVQDNTARTEDDLRAKAALFEAQVNSSFDGILVVDPQGRKVLQNQRMISVFFAVKIFAEKEG